MKLAHDAATIGRALGESGNGVTPPDAMKPFFRLPEGLAVHGVFWRQCIDWVVLHLPSVFHPFLIFISTALFFVVAAPARRTVVQHLGIILPGSWRIANYLRAFRVFQNFAWTLTDAAVHRLLKAPFGYEVEGDQFLNELAAAKGAIVLTAHMGNYDLGAAIFVEKFQRQIRLVRAPEPDALAAKHLDRSIEQSAAGGVRVDYNTEGALLSFDLLNALRSGEIISIQGDRSMGEIAHSPVTMFGHKALLPTGPFVLALAAQVPIFPLFVIRSGYRRYRFVFCPPIICARTGRARDEDIAAAMQKWSEVLADAIGTHWEQWHAFTPIFQGSPRPKHASAE
jgi:lauroyl/myristoyl acyltransferase